MLRIFLPFILLNVFNVSGLAQTDWNQYLGPDRNATVYGAGIARSWPAEGPAKLWSFPLGPGFGGASIYGDEVFVLDRKAEETDVLRCIDLQTGNEKWSFSYEAKGAIPYPGSRATPTVDEKYIWMVGPHGHMHCVDKNTHQPVWSHDLLAKYGGELPNWGFSQSPILYKDLVIVAPQGEKAGVAAFSKQTGQVVWESRRLSGYRFHVSPALGKYGGLDQIIMISSCVKDDGMVSDEVVAFEAGTGKELWTYKGLNSFASIAPATIVDSTRLLLSECAYNDKYDPVTVMLEIKKKGDQFEVKELFFNTQAGSKIHPPVIHENHIYLNNTAKVRMQMTCLTMNGQEVWAKGSAPGFDLGGMIMIDGLIINQNGKNGDIHLIEPSPDGYKETGKASFFNSQISQAWAPLAYSKGRLIVRDMEQMICVELKK